MKRSNAQQTIKSSDKQQKGAKKKAERGAAKDALTLLAGKLLSEMNKKEREAYDVAIGQLLGLLDETGRVKSIL